MEMGSEQPQDKAVSRQQQSGGGGQRGHKKGKEKKRHHQYPPCTQAAGLPLRRCSGFPGRHAQPHPTG